MIKKYLLVFTVLTILTSCKQDKPVDYVLISGTITNPNSTKLTIFDTSRSKVQGIMVSNGGTFSDTLRVAEGYYGFSDGKEQSTIYLKPGYNLTLTLDTKEFDETIKYSGEGSIENNFLAQKALFNEKITGDTKTFYSLGLDDFKAKTTEQRVAVETLIDNTEDLNNEFGAQEKKNALYEYALALKSYKNYHRFFTKEEIALPENFYDEIKDIALDNEADYQKSTAYKQLVVTHYEQLAGDLVEKDGIDAALALLKVIVTQVKNAVIKEDLLYNNAKYRIAYTKDLENYYSLFTTHVTNEKHKEEITKAYNTLKKIAKGNPSPQFVNYENYKGGTTSLIDLKGKYVYIDVWATWCGPCKREIPHLKEVEKKYHNKNIEFVSISIDTKKAHDKWKQMVADKELSGVQLFADNDWNSEFIKEYQITGIPRFILVDPKGNIIDANAPRPSDPKLKSILDSF